MNSILYILWQEQRPTNHAVLCCSIHVIWTKVYYNNIKSANFFVSGNQVQLWNMALLLFRQGTTTSKSRSLLVSRCYWKTNRCSRTQFVTQQNSRELAQWQKKSKLRNTLKENIISGLFLRTTCNNILEDGWMRRNEILSWGEIPDVSAFGQ